MKKAFLLFLCVFTLIFTAAVYADENAAEPTPILIKTADCSAAIADFKENWGGNTATIARHGFGENSYIGTPFALEYMYEYGTVDLSYRFPIITGGKIVSWIGLDPTDDENAPEKFGWYFGELIDDIDILADGSEYIVVCNRTDIDDFIIGISDDKTTIVFGGYFTGESDIPIPTPSERERTVVDITKPLEGLDTSALIPQTEEETALFETAKEEGKTVQTFSAKSVGAINKNARLLLPLRDIAELMGCEVSWQAETKTAAVQKGGNTCEFTVGKATFTANGSELPLDVPAEIIEGKTYVPLRAAAEALDIEITYNPDSKMVTIKY